MSSKTRTLAIMLSAVLVLSVLGSGLAFAGTASAMTNHEDMDDGECEFDDGETYDENESIDENETEDDETDGDCEMDDGTENDSTDHEPFGNMVTAFVHGLIAGSGDATNDTNTTNDKNVMDVTNDENMTLGQQIAAFVVENNPGNAPDHAGPKNDTGQPDHAGPNGNDTGKPAHADNKTGKPEHAGSGGDAGPSSDENHAGGPPEHAGN